MGSATRMREGERRHRAIIVHEVLSTRMTRLSISFSFHHPHPHVERSYPERSSVASLKSRIPRRLYLYEELDLDTDDASIVPYPISEEFLLSCPCPSPQPFLSFCPSLSGGYSLSLLSSSRRVNGFGYEARAETWSE